MGGGETNEKQPESNQEIEAPQKEARERRKPRIASYIVKDTVISFHNGSLVLWMVERPPYSLTTLSLAHFRQAPRLPPNFPVPFVDKEPVAPRTYSATRAALSSFLPRGSGTILAGPGISSLSLSHLRRSSCKILSFVVVVVVGRRLRLAVSLPWLLFTPANVQPGGT